MAYDARLPRAIDRIRSILGDVEDVEVLPDGTYQALIDAADSEDAATLEIARRVRARLKLNRPVISSAEGVSANYTARMDHLDEVIRRYEALVPAENPAASPRTAQPSASVRTEASW